MNLTVEIPDDLARRLSAAGGDLSRRALEAFALEEYKSKRMRRPNCAASWASIPATSLMVFSRHMMFG